MNRQISRGGSFLFAAMAAVVVVVAGCTDMTTQQYDAQQVKQQLEQCQSAQGTYNGTITSLDGQTPIGGIQIITDCVEQPVPSSDGTTTDSQVTMTGSVRIIGETTSEAPLSGGYAPDTGQLTGTITISTSPLVTLQIGGTISGSNFSGTIISNQYGQQGGRFTAVLNGELPPAQGALSGQPVSHLSQYGGPDATSGCTLEGQSCVVTLSIDDTPSSSADAFSDALTSVSDVVVHVTINMGDTSADPLPLDYTFGGSNGTAELNRRDGTLDGQASAQGVNTTDNLSCTAIASGGWACTLDKAGFRVAPSTSAVN